MKRKQREESEAGFDHEEGDEDDNDDEEEGATPPPAKRTNVFRSPDKLSDDKMKRKRRSQEESVKKNKKEDKLKNVTEDSNIETTSCESSEDKMVEGEMEGGKKKSSTPVKEHSSGVNIKVVEVTI